MFRVNVVTGELCLSITEVFLPGVMAVDFTRLYRSRVHSRGLFGPGWSHPYQLVLTPFEGQFVLAKAGEELHRFRKDDGSYAPFSARRQRWILAPCHRVFNVEVVPVLQINRSNASGSNRRCPRESARLHL